MKTQFYAFVFLVFLLVTFNSVLKAQDTTVSNLPCFYITTVDSAPVDDRENYVDGSLRVAGGSPDSGYYSGAIQIRGRGNSTWDFPKKPYRIKLASKYNLLGMPAKAKSWVLLANYADKTLMRNAVAFEVSKFFGFTYTPAYRMADVFLNGDYLGTYTITDQIETGSGRVDVEEQSTKDTTLPNISGGYLIEVGGAPAFDSPHYATTRNVAMEIKTPDDPDDINPQQKNYIIDYVQQFENALFASNFKDSGNGYQKYADMKSLADWYLLNELCANSDTYWSTYMYKYRTNPKLYMGPMWDYDIAFDNDSRLGDETYKYMRDFAHEPKVWITRLLQDENFYQTVKKRWVELKSEGIVPRMQTVIDSLSMVLSQSQKLNYKRWHTLKQIVYLELEARGSYHAEVIFLKKFVNTHASWLSSEFNGFPRDQKYNIVSGQTGKVWDIENSSKADGKTVVQFTGTAQKQSQVWKAVNLRNGYYKIVNINSGKVVSNGGSSMQETKLFQTKFMVDDSTQQWRIINTGSHYGIINRASLQAADNFGSIYTDNNSVTQFPQDIYNRDNQFYTFVKINTDSSISTDSTKAMFSLYPNPAVTSNVNIRLQLNADAAVKVFIYDPRGLLVKQVNKGTLLKGKNSFIMSVAGLRTGNYTIAVKAGEETTSQLLFVK